MSFSWPSGSSARSIFLPPLWKDQAIKASNLRKQGGFTLRFELQSWQGRFTVKLGLTILIPQALPTHTMECFDSARKALNEQDIIRTVLASPRLKGVRVVDVFWAWEELYRKYPLDTFLRMLEKFYAQVWGLAREKLLAQGFRYLPFSFRCSGPRLHSLSDFIAAYPTSPAPRTPFVVDRRSIRIVIPALPPSSTTSTIPTTLSIDAKDVPDIPYDSLTDEEKADLSDHLRRVAKTTIQKADLKNGGWDLPGFNSKRYEFDMCPKELQRRAWVGDAALHKLSREVLTEVEPALPLGCIKAVAKTFNSNAVQSELPRCRGWYQDPSNFSKQDADHWGGTFVEGGFSLPYETHSLNNRELPKEWVRKDLRLVGPPLVQGYKDFFAARKQKSRNTNLGSEKHAAAITSSSSSTATAQQPLPSQRTVRNRDTFVSAPSLSSRLGSPKPSPSSSSICTISGPSRPSSLSLLERIKPPPPPTPSETSSCGPSKPYASVSLLRRIAPLPSRPRGYVHGSNSVAARSTPSNHSMQRPVAHGSSIQRKAGTSSSTGSTNNNSPPPTQGTKRVLRDVDLNVERPRKTHYNGRGRFEGSGNRGRW